MLLLFYCGIKSAVIIDCFLIHAGWFARDPSVLRKVGHVLLQQPHQDNRRARHILIADDCFSLSDTQNKQLAVILSSIENVYGSTPGFPNSKSTIKEKQYFFCC
jgi:hypothetical protein